MSNAGRGGDHRSNQRYQATPEASARLLLLIDGFSRKANGVPRALEGRVKLAKLDFLFRYPQQLLRLLATRPDAQSEKRLATATAATLDTAPFDARMVRFRYGPWDPAYYAVLGSLIGRGLVDMIPLSGGTGFGYRTTSRGEELSLSLGADEAFGETVARVRLLRQHFDLSGTTLKKMLYELPEVADAAWHEEL